MTSKKTSSFAAFDTQSDCDVPLEFELLDKQRKPSGLFLSVVGKDGTAFNDFLEAKRKERQGQAILAQRLGGEVAAPTVDQMKRDNAELLAACTTGWRADEKRFGPVDPFTKEAAVELYYSSKTARDQADAVIGEVTRFTDR
jgi:hypothetical protein